MLFAVIKKNVQQMAKDIMDGLRKQKIHLNAYSKKLVRASPQHYQKMIPQYYYHFTFSWL
jgi:hypothetical protein